MMGNNAKAKVNIFEALNFEKIKLLFFFCTAVETLDQTLTST